MRLRILSLWVLTFVFSIAGAQQQLTLEEAVTGQFGKFAPETLDQNKWIAKSNSFMYVKENQVWTEVAAGKSKSTKLFSLHELNTWKGGNTLKSIPALEWLNASEFYFRFENSIYEANLKSKTVALACSFSKDAENHQYHSATRQMAFTKANNLFVQKADKQIQITENQKQVVSGQSISRNEYGITKGIFWNNEGSKIAFYQKDESKVTDYPLTNYNSVPATVKEIKYPFAGMPSELVSVGVFDLKSGKTLFLNPKNSDTDQFYLTNLSWSPDNKTIYIAWLNRKTTDLRLIAFDAATGEEIKTLFTEHDDKWLEPEHAAIFLPANPNQFLWLSRRDGFTNLYLYHTDGNLIANSKLKFDITEVVGFDKLNKHVFVMATGENPTNSHCYKIKLADMNAELLTAEQGTHRVSLSDDGTFLIDKYSNLNTPLKIDLIDANGRVIRNLLTSKNPYESKSIGQTEIFPLKANDGTDLWCRMIKPTNFDDTKKYPVLVYVYNGPHVQLVTNSYLGGASLWMNYLAEKGYLVFTLDGHGSANRGKDFEQIIHRQLGTQEIEDQLIGAEWLKNQPFVDAERMAIHGWSYGGFMTTSLMLRAPGAFKVGVAGGPVIDWSLYEVMYGERYMDTPQENPEGYKTADLTKHVKNLKGDLLMIHGADDDVVVMQHNMKFLKACVDNKVQVDFFAYPGHAHNVRGKDRVHLITKIIDYIQEKL